MSSPTTFAALAWPVLAIAFALAWRRQLRTADATAVDALWAAAIGVGAATAAATADGSAPQRWLAVLCAGPWSLRLCWHLVRDRLRPGAAEDGRYRALRHRLGARAKVGFFWLYQTQALLALGCLLPFVWLAHAATPAVTGMQVAGLGLAAAAQALEALADHQLAAHRRDPAQRGRTCRRGLWRHSRHPNYFFEWLTWCGFGLVTGEALGALAALAPAAMGLLIRFVTGVPFAERQALASRGDDYRRYQRETSVFLPLPGRRPATPASRSPSPADPA